MDKYHPSPRHPFGRLGIFGHCDHGLWRGGEDNHIRTEDNVVIPIRGAIPAETTLPYEQNRGNSRAIRVPGTPPVERSPEAHADDRAAGRTWLDYGVISGARNRLYGVELGEATWIYAPSDGSRWLVELTDDAIRFSRFGCIPQAADEPRLVSISPVYIPVPEGADGLVGFRVLDDVNDDGSQFVVTTGVYSCPWDTNTEQDHYLRYPYVIRRFVISGVPPLVTVQEIVENDSYGYLGSTSSNTYTTWGYLHWYKTLPSSSWRVTEWATDTEPPSYEDGWSLIGRYYLPNHGSETARYERALGGAFVDNEFRFVRWISQYTETRAFEYDPVRLEQLELGGSGLEVSGTFDVELVIQLYVGDTPLVCTIQDESPAGATLQSDRSVIWNHQSDTTMLMQGNEVACGDTVSPSSYSISAYEQVIGQKWGLFPYRLANRAWSLAAVNLGAVYADLGLDFGWIGSGGGDHIHIGVAGPGEPLYTFEAIPIGGPPPSIHGYASVHPATGEITRDTEPICYV